MRLLKTLKFASISITIVVLALGVYSQTQLLEKNRPRKLLREKLAQDYAVVMPGKKKMPTKTKAVVKKLRGELRRIKNNSLTTAFGEESVASKLTLVLGAFNKCAQQTKLKIDKISITGKNISITGNTSSRQNTLKLFEEIKKTHLEILVYRYDLKGGYDNFTLTVVPKK